LPVQQAQPKPAMQSKKQIQQLLASAGIQPTKRFGQHFLVDLNLMGLLVETAKIGPEDIVLEVGCGTGSLTEAIAERAGWCIAVEIDSKLASIAQQMLAKFKNVTILNTDILKTKNSIAPSVIKTLQELQHGFAGRLLLVANLPYNVACPVMTNLVWGPVYADGMYVTVQKEVAQRMTAPAGSRDYGILSILLNIAGEVKIERILKTEVFWPRPEVDSAMVSFIRQEQRANQVRDWQLLNELLSLFMGHRRKTLNACIKLARGRLAQINNWQQILKRASVDPGDRPEELTPQTYLTLAKLCGEQLRRKVRGLN